jgi:hypothetical protein
MADRTLRRKLQRNEGNSPSNVDVDSNDAGTNDESIERITNDDSIVDGNGNNIDIESNSDSGIRVVEIDPADIGKFIADGTGTGTGDGDQPRKRRGRKPGTGNTRKTKAPDSVEPLIEMVHTWAAILLKTPELQLDKDEVKKLSDSYVEFAQHHEVPLFTAKRMSEINLIACVSMIYLPRFFAVRNRMKDESKVKRAKNVTPFSATGD